MLDVLDCFIAHSLSPRIPSWRGVLELGTVPDAVLMGSEVTATCVKMK